jgi:predicted phosphodiesterase
LVITVDNGSVYKYYLDGELINQAIVQEIDGRFALNPVLLMFADEDGEDNNIIVTEIGIWNRPLSEPEVSELGGFSHPGPESIHLIAYPFLQSLTKNSVYVCWHDTSQIITKVEYGISQSLGSSETGTSEMVVSPYRWHSVKLTGLTAGTKYFYRIVSGTETSAVYTFKTMPDDNYGGHIRFLLFSDTQDDSLWTGNIVRNAKLKVQQLYGEDISESINLVMHTGDIVGSGNVVTQWTNQFFKPFKTLTANVPVLTVAGNHEGEHPNYYKYIKYDEFSAFPSSHPLFEKIWTYRMPRILLVGMNTNVIGTYGETQKEWLDAKLLEAENDSSIDFVFCFLHHPPVSELWGEGNTSYVADDILGVLKKYSKVQQLSYGHTHAYEMGVVESEAANQNGDFRISCVGGGGGDRDRWGEYTNFDYPQVQTAIDHYFYVLFDFDLADKSYTGQMFDLGNVDYLLDNEVSDSWHRKIDQPKPDKPVVFAPTYSAQGNVVLNAVDISGPDELMTSQFLVTGISGNYSAPAFSKSTDWQNIYGVDNFFQPINLNSGVDLTEVKVPVGTLNIGDTYFYKVRYRDQNLKWSDWSDEVEFTVINTAGIEDLIPANDCLLQNCPNPFNHSTEIKFGLKNADSVILEVFDGQGKLVKTLANRVMEAGYHSFTFDASELPGGVYSCKIRTSSFSDVKKMMFVE